MHPKVFSYFHGDYDDDEYYMYAIGSPKFIAEAREWGVPLDGKLCKAERYMEKNFPGECSTEPEGGGMEFMEYTTLSFREILDGRLDLPMGDWVRCKKEHLRMLRGRIKAGIGTKGFLQESIQGRKRYNETAVVLRENR